MICYDRDRLHRARPEEVFLSDKIIIQRISGGSAPIVATLDKDKYYTFASTNNLILKEDVDYDIRYILGLLNSNLINWYYSINYSNRSDLTVNVSKTFLEELPIKIANKSDQKKLIDLVEKMNVMKKDIINMKHTDKKIALQDKVIKISQEINREVYKLYNLTKKDIDIIEKSLT